MKNRVVLTAIIIAALSISAPSAVAQQRNSPAAVVYSRAASLQDVVNEAAHAALTKFADKKLTEAQLSITLIDLRDPQHPVTASFRGNERVYPASVVKLFYIVCRLLLEKKNSKPACWSRASTSRHLPGLFPAHMSATFIRWSTSR